MSPAGPGQPRRIPDWVLERHAVGELPPGYTPEDLAADPTVPERLAALRRSNAEILQQHAPGAVAREVLRRHARGPARTLRVGPWLPVLVPAMVTAAVVAVVVSRSAASRLPEVEEDRVTFKGSVPALEVYRQADGPPVRLADRAEARPGDVLQLRIVSAGAAYGAVVSIDGNGSVTLHAPSRIGPAIALRPQLTLASAYALDAAPRFERFILVTSAAPFDAAAVVAAARSAGPEETAPLALPEGLQQFSIVVRKVLP